MSTPKRIKIVPAGTTKICLSTPSGQVDVRLDRVVLDVGFGRWMPFGRLGEHDGTIYHTEDFPYDVASRIASGEVEVVK